MKIFLLTMLMTLSSSVRAISGNELMESCRGTTSNSRWGFCVGYVVGVVDQARESNETLCVPAESIQSQVARVATRWLDENPGSLHYSAPSQVRAALRHAFPCKKLP